VNGIWYLLNKIIYIHDRLFNLRSYNLINLNPLSSYNEILRWNADCQLQYVIANVPIRHHGRRLP
jgi:hypothetical protein